MELNQDHKNDIEEEQKSFWLSSSSIPVIYYQEPKLHETTVEVVKAVCDALEQSQEVFITSVDILERYIDVKPYKSIYNSLTILVCAILMSSKLVGSDTDVKIATLQDIIYKISKQQVDKASIRATELEVLLTLGNLPLNTIITDLIMFLEYYVKNMKLKVDITPLCLEILNLMYLSRKQFFYHAKSLYSKDYEALNVFKHLVCNKFYFVGGIVLCAFKITKLKDCLNIEEIAEDIGRISGIHVDHLYLISEGLRELVKASQAEKTEKVKN